MFSQPATGRAQLAVLLLLATLTVGAFCTRIVAIAEPLGIDQSLWASAANGMAHGQRLYRDVWEQRPPGIYWIYEAGFRVLGSTPATVVWLDILASAATCLLLFLIAHRLSTPLTAALTAALVRCIDDAVVALRIWRLSRAQCLRNIHRHLRGPGYLCCCARRATQVCGGSSRTRPCGRRRSRAEAERRSLFSRSAFVDRLVRRGPRHGRSWHHGSRWRCGCARAGDCLALAPGPAA